MSAKILVADPLIPPPMINMVRFFQRYRLRESVDNDTRKKDMGTALEQFQSGALDNKDEVIETHLKSVDSYQNYVREDIIEASLSALRENCLESIPSDSSDEEGNDRPHSALVSNMYNVPTCGSNECFEYAYARHFYGEDIWNLKDIYRKNCEEHEGILSCVLLNYPDSIPPSYPDLKTVSLPPPMSAFLDKDSVSSKRLKEQDFKLLSKKFLHLLRKTTLAREWSDYNQDQRIPEDIEISKQWVLEKEVLYGTTLDESAEACHELALYYFGNSLSFERKGYVEEESPGEYLRVMNATLHRGACMGGIDESCKFLAAVPDGIHNEDERCVFAELACQMGNADSCVFSLACLAREGETKELLMNKMFQAAQMGTSVVQVSNSVIDIALQLRDAATALEMAEESCTNFENNIACFNAGYIWDKGLGGLISDPQEAFEYYTRSCALGNIDGCYNAFLLQEGKNTPHRDVSIGNIVDVME